MLYLIQVQNDKLKLLKIGYSDNWKHRKSKYLLHNPLTEIINTKEEGDEILEKLFHLRYQDFSYPDYGREWFIYNESIIEGGGFRDETEETLLGWLWDNRLEILDCNYFKESHSTQYKIVEKLYSGRELDWRNKYDNLWDTRIIKNIDYKTIGAKDDLQEVYIKFEKEFEVLREFRDRMKLYCDFLDRYYDIIKTTDLPCIPREFQNYVNLLGTKRIKALGCQKSDLENEYKIIISQDNARESILSLFQVGSKLLLRDIKEQLQKLYNSLDIKKTAKASDLENYFELKDIRIKMEDGRQSKGYELLKIKY